MYLLCRKRFYPFEWVDSHDKLNQIGLPSQDSFYSALHQKSISDDEYEHAQNVYRKLNCNSFNDYHRTCLQCDVLLLADIFENFGNIFQQFCDLDPATYITLPGAAWDAMLRMTNIKLELISDEKVLDIIERQRGWFMFCR